MVLFESMGHIAIFIQGLKKYIFFRVANFSSFNSSGIFNSFFFCKFPGSFIYKTERFATRNIIGKIIWMKFPGISRSTVIASPILRFFVRCQYLPGIFKKISGLYCNFATLNFVPCSHYFESTVLTFFDSPMLAQNGPFEVYCCLS